MERSSVIKFRFGRVCLSWLLLCIAAGAFSQIQTRASVAGADQATVIVVVGAAGEEDYGKQFVEWTELWQKASHKGEAKFVGIGFGERSDKTDYDLLKDTLSGEPKESTGELWLVLIGHGTYDGKEAKFNLRGPDLSATECASWLQPFRRAVAVINCASSSGPFLNQLSAPGRVVITSTKSGFEQNFSRFGQHLSQAILDPEADLDKDGQTSLLEAFLTASHRVADFYNTEGRLATEHALLDDNGDARGTPADWFRGARAVKKAVDGAAPDGLRAHQFHLVKSQRERELSPALRTKRDQLELAIARLRDAKSEFSEEEYFKRLEKILLELAHLYENAGKKTAAGFE
jgi:hypothetical protein